jgi:two-component system, sporulation sensor kinase E
MNPLDSHTIEHESNGNKKINILMVDDHPKNLLALEAVLNSPNYNLVCASSGEEALKCVLKQDFAIILLDVQMPGLNGFETAKIIKEREKSKYISIIFITANNQTTEHVLQGYSLGAVDYIIKPFHPETLKMKVQEFVKIYQNQEKMKLSELRRQSELKVVNEKLERTTLDLRKNEVLAKVIGETLLDTIITFDRRGLILSVNPAVKTMFGYAAEELLGQHVINLLPAVKFNNNETTPFRIKTLSNKKGQIFEAIAKHKNEGNFPVDIQIGEARIDDEQIFVLSIRDITLRKKEDNEKKQQYIILEKLVEERTRELLIANKKLRKEIDERKKIVEDLRLSQEHFYRIFESSPCLIEIRSLTDGRYINVNSSWLNYTGYSNEEVIHQNTSIIHLTTDLNNEEENQRLETKGNIRNANIQYQTKSGEIREGLLSTEIFEIQSEPCIMKVITDITERIHLEREMTRLDRLNLIGAMAAGIAHEIRNPMTTVRGFLELSKSDPKHLTIKYIDLMLGELKRANSIITEYLNLAKNKLSYKTLQNLNPIIEGLYPLIQAEALRTGKSIILELDNCPDLFLDEKEISQLILNLSLNGLDAMKSGGKLVIKTYIEEETAILEVKDEGCGIKSELLQEIGTPFFTTKDTGTGLGLAICYSIAKRHNAKIDLKTSEQGTSFFIRFNEIKKD